MRPGPALAALLLLSLAAQLAAAQEAQRFTLEWGDTGKELLPGYKVEAATHGVGVALSWLSGFADAVVCIGGKCFGVVGDDGIIPVNVRLRVHGVEDRLIDRLWLGKAEYSVYWSFTLHCPGEPVAGVRPPSGWAVLEARAPDWGVERYYLVDLGSGAAPDIRYFYESTPGVQSWVEILESTRLEECGVEVAGEPPSGGEGNRPEPATERVAGWLSGLLEKALLYLVVGMVAVYALALLLARR